MTQFHTKTLMIVAGDEIEVSKVKYPAVIEGMKSYGVVLQERSSSARIIWFDGDIKAQDFRIVAPSQRISRIPGMDIICYKSTFVHAMNQCRRLFPAVFSFFPRSYLLPHQYDDFQRDHTKCQNGNTNPVTWIVKPRSGCGGRGIYLIQHTFEVMGRTEQLVIQRYIPPFLLGGFKFDFRFYLLVSTMSPYTVYIYNEGLARFCTAKYQNPDVGNVSNMFVHLTNTAINMKNGDNKDETGEEFTKLASIVLAEIKKSSGRGAEIWQKIKEISTMTMLAIWPTIVNSGKVTSSFGLDKNAFLKPDVDTKEPRLESFSRYFHLLGIDIMIDSCCRPIVLELNDRPSLVIKYEVERDLKTSLIRDTLQTISTDGSPVDPAKASANWERLLPVVEGTPSIASIQHVMNYTASVFRTCMASRERPHYIDVSAYKPTFGTTF